VFNNAPGQYVEGKAAKHIFNYITNEDYQGLLLHLKSGNCHGDLLRMQDSRNFTVLTYSAYKNDTNCFKILFEYAFKTSSKHEMNAWANQTTDDQFTALHFATKHGNYTMLTYLVERASADLYI
jgi:ankyrin repeat protein